VIRVTPEKHRAALVLCYLEGKTRAEAAQLLGCLQGSMFGRLARGHELLWRRLTRRGLGLATGLPATALAASAVSAMVPAALVTKTVKAGPMLDAGKAAAAGVVSMAVAAIWELGWGVFR
jgi:hypothetical protein